MGKFSKLAMGVVKPVLKKFNIKVPAIPGLSKVGKLLDGMQQNYNTFKGEINILDKSAKDFAKQQLNISKNLKKIERSTGCQISINQ